MKWIADRLGALQGTFDPFAQIRQKPGAFAGFMERRRARSEAEDFGRRATAGWEEDGVMRRRGLREGDIFLGRVSGSLRPVGIATEKHFVTLGSPGSGKSTGGLIPNLVLHEGSALVIDPKGELAQITAARRGAGGNGVKGMGQDVHVLDPFGLVEGIASSSYNVFDDMTRIAARNPDRPVSYAGKIAEALIKPAPDSRDPYWDNAARTLLRGLILYMFQGEGERSLGALRRLTMEGDAAEWERQPADVRSGVTPFEMLFEKMKRAPAGPYRDAIVAAGSSMLGMGPNQMGSVLTTAQEHTAFLDAPELRRVCERSDFSLEDFRDKKLSVYLCLPLNMVTGKEARWLRMFVVLFIDMMLMGRQAPKPPVLLAIDEFPSLGRIDGIENVAPTMRSYGVRFWAVAQDISQLKAVYPDCWSGFIGNAEAVQFMGVTHAATVDFISERLGKHLVEGRQDGRLVRMERPLLEAEQVGRLLWPTLQNQIVWRGSRRPMKLKVTPYYEYLPAWYYSPDPRYPEAAKRRRFR